MTWFKLDDQFHSHPKVLTAGNAAVGLYCRLGTWVADKLTDGFIPAGVAKSMGTPRELKALTTPPAPGMGALLVPVEGGYRMPDYLDYNPTREKVLADREAAKSRMQRLRGSGEVRANKQANSGRSSHSPDPVPSSTTDTSPPKGDSGGGGSKSVDKRAAAVLTAYGLMAVQMAKSVGDPARYAAKAERTCEAHPDFERYVAEYPDAPASAVAAWLHGDKNSMRYYEAIDPSAPDADVVNLSDRRPA